MHGSITHGIVQLREVGDDLVQPRGCPRLPVVHGFARVSAEGNEDFVGVAHGRGTRGTQQSVVGSRARQLRYCALKCCCPSKQHTMATTMYYGVEEGVNSIALSSAVRRTHARIREFTNLGIAATVFVVSGAEEQITIGYCPAL